MHLIRISSRNTRAVINGASDTSGHPASNKHSARYCPAVSRGIGTNGPNRQKTWPCPSIRPIPHPLTPPLRTMPLQPLVPSHRTITKRPPTTTLAFRYHSFLRRQSAHCSPVAFNDIKHLTRSMPADGLEAQDVVPPRCGCWVAHKASICPHFHMRGPANHGEGVDLLEKGLGCTLPE